MQYYKIENIQKRLEQGFLAEDAYLGIDIIGHRGDDDDFPGAAEGGHGQGDVPVSNGSGQGGSVQLMSYRVVTGGHRQPRNLEEHKVGIVELILNCYLF